MISSDFGKWTKCPLAIFSFQSRKVKVSQFGNFHPDLYQVVSGHFCPLTKTTICIAAMRQKGNSMNFMNTTTPIIIGIDHGYGNIKTAHCCFKTALQPTTKSRHSKAIC